MQENTTSLQPQAEGEVAIPAAIQHIVNCPIVKLSTVFDGIMKNLKFLGADGQILTAGKSGKVPPGQVSQTGNVTEAFQYFYYPDHLGSTSYVTDASGEVYQHLEYFPFGRTSVKVTLQHIIAGARLFAFVER